MAPNATSAAPAPTPAPAPTSESTAVPPSAPAAPSPAPKRICCACPQTKAERDECIVLRGEDACRELVDAHKACLRAEGFNV